MNSRKSFPQWLAIYLVLFAFAFQFDKDGLYWLWEGRPIAALILLLSGISIMLYGTVRKLVQKH